MIMGHIASVIIQIFLAILLIPLAAAWFLSLGYWIEFRTVWQMIYRLIPVSVITAVFFHVWLEALFWAQECCTGIN